MRERIVTYIAHPLRGEKPYTDQQVTDNFAKINNICRKLVFEKDYIIPISPIHTFNFITPFELDEEVIMDFCYSLMNACDEVWVFGDWKNSVGCLMEIKKAISLGKVVRIRRSDMSEQFSVFKAGQLDKVDITYDCVDKDELADIRNSYELILAQ